MPKLFQEIPYTVVERDIRNPRIEFKTGQMQLILPKGYSEETILEKHHDWIQKKKKEINSALQNSHSLTLSEEKKEKILQQVYEINLKIKAPLKQISIRKLTTKWGSYSRNATLTLNQNIRLLPNELADYIISHELTHANVPKHNNHFWKIISKRHKDYMKKEELLFSYWFLINKQNEKRDSKLSNCFE